jgi:hypothetical protein
MALDRSTLDCLPPGGCDHHTGNLDLPLTSLRVPAGFEMIALNVLG